MDKGSGVFPMGRFVRIYEDASNTCSPEGSIVSGSSVALGQIAPYGLCVFRLTDG